MGIKNVFFYIICCVLSFSPGGPINRFAHFCTAVGIAIIITCDIFLSISLGMSILWGGVSIKKKIFPLTKPVAVNTKLAQLHSLRFYFVEKKPELTLKKYDRRRENSRQKTDVGYLGLSSLIFSSISIRGRVSQLSHV